MCPRGGTNTNFLNQFKSSDNFLLISSGKSCIRQNGFNVKEMPDSKPIYCVVPNEKWLMYCERAVKEYNGTLSAQESCDGKIEVIE